MSKELNAVVEIDRLEIDLLRRVELKGLYIQDLKGDTLIYAPSAKCLLQNYSIRKRIINLDEISLIHPRIKIAKYKGDKDLNFEFLADYFDDGKKSGKKSRPWKLGIKRIKVKNANFSLDNFNKSYRRFGIDFDHLGLYPLNVNLSEFSNLGDTSECLVKNLSLREKSGFIVDTLNTRLKITPTSLLLSPLKIKTPSSLIHASYLSFHFTDTDDFDDFEEKVNIKSFITRSSLNLGDLSFFASELQNSKQDLLLHGKFNGTVNDFEVSQFTCAYSKNTYLKGDFKIKDITETDKAYFDLNIKKLTYTGKDLATFEIPPYDGETFIDLPTEARNLGDVDYTGTFKGTLTNFASRGSLLSSIGLAKLDLDYATDTTTKRYQIKGHLASTDFNAGKILDESTLGNVTSDFNFKVHGTDFKRNMFIELAGDIPLLTMNGYPYHNCKVDGKVKNETFVGDFKIKDENIYLSYHGYYNYGKKIPEYDFTASVHNAAITALNLGNRDESATLSFKIKTTGRGIDPDDLRGDISITNINFCEFGKEYDFKDVTLKAEEFKDSSKRIYLNSEIMEAEIKGKFTFTEIPAVFLSITSKAVPSLFDNKKVEIKTNEVFTYKATIKDFTKIQQLFIPELELSKDAVIDGRFDSKQDIFRFTGKNINKLKYNDQYFQNLKFITKNNGDYITTTINAENLQVNDSISFQGLKMETSASNNNVISEINWKNKSENSGNLFFEGSILSHNEFNFTLRPSKIKVNQDEWTNAKDACIDIDSSTITISDFDARNGMQAISVNGSIAENEREQLIASLSNFQLEAITPLLLGSDLSFKGGVNGNIIVSNVYDRPYFKNLLSIDSLVVNDEWVGDVQAQNTYEKGSDRIITNAKILRKDMPNITMYGNYYINKETENLDYVFEFSEANLKFLNGFMPKEDVSNFESLANGKVTLTGTPEEPLFNGKLKVYSGSVKINMLNTSYFIEKGNVTIYPDMIALDQMSITDVKGNGGTVNGTYNHTNFEKGNYGFDIDFKNMLCLNTNEELNDLYYGKAYASGTASIVGAGDKIDITIDAKTNKNTKLTMPMYGVSDVTLGDFVVFVNKDSIIKEKEIDLEGITLTFNLDVTPEAEINIVFDKFTGQQLKARGNGDIRMEITPLGDFNMNGEYEIEDPSSYKLAMQTIINKNFIVAKGGRIKWSGDPLNADIDITALYKLQASVFDIMPIDLQSNYRKNVDVNVEIKLKNSLYKPDFVFDFTVPKADENVKAAVASVKNTREELFRQTMSLLIINKFLTPTNAIGTNSQSSGNIAANYTSELITNQLNSLLSQISKDVDIGVNYKPGDEISNDEIALALSTQILNGRLNISTNVGYSGGTASNSNQSSLIGDFNIEYLISEEGDIRVRGYNESNDFDITNANQSPYTQGIGLYYQKEFDNSREIKMLQRFLNIFRKEENDWIDKEAEKKKAEKKAQKQKEKEEKEKNSSNTTENKDQ